MTKDRPKGSPAQGPKPMTEPQLLSALAEALDAATEYTIVKIEASGGIVAALAIYPSEMSEHDRKVDLDRVFKKGKSSDRCEALCFVLGSDDGELIFQYPAGPPMHLPEHPQRARASALCRTRVEDALAALRALSTTG